MNEPIAYQWEFERSGWDSVPGAATFSVGIYQWLPKASGGLKKSKMIRVNGYTAEPERVYEKARELCERLNAEGICAESPPPWLRKQYSVPRPEDSPPKERGEELDGSQVRSLRTRVMRTCLLPQGFVRGSGTTYVRKQGDQLHLVDFQASRWGHEYTVNLGFHYSFMPGLHQRRSVEPAELRLLDCGATSRLGFFAPEGLDRWQEYGTDPDLLERRLTRDAQEALAIFTTWSERWKDPAWWLDAYQAGTLIERLSPWMSLRPEPFLAGIALHLGRRAQARELLEELLRKVTAEVDRRFLGELLARATGAG